MCVSERLFLEFSQYTLELSQLNALLGLGEGGGGGGGHSLIESLRFPQRGRQRERHHSFLCFPSKKLTTKICHKRLTGQFIR